VDRGGGDRLQQAVNRMLVQARDLALALSVVAVAGCSPAGPDWDVNCPTTRVLSIEAGNSQTGTAGATLPVRLGVSPRTPSGFLCPGLSFPDAQVVWAVERGGGAVAPVPPEIPGDTRQYAVWTLGPELGRQTVRATWTNSGAPTAPFVMFEATAVSPQ